MSRLLVERLKLSFQLYEDLIEFVPESLLKQKLPGLPSNEFGQQLWCVIGARTSYLEAMKAGEWCGFSCPLDWSETGSKAVVRSQLATTAASVLRFVVSDSEYSDELLIQLLEHELVHQGQLIRYLYGHKLGVPESWKQRYNLN